MTEPTNANAEPVEESRQELENQVREAEKKYLYLYAEFENFKKRTLKERSDLLKFGWEALARDLLQVLDNLERALAHMPADTDKNFSQGLEMVMNQFKSTLERQGIRPIETADQAFDPNLHEAVGEEESDRPTGTIIREHLRGYTLHGRLLRPARVSVSGGKAQNNGGSHG